MTESGKRHSKEERREVITARAFLHPAIFPLAMPHTCVLITRGLTDMGLYMNVNLRERATNFYEL